MTEHHEMRPIESHQTEFAWIEIVYSTRDRFGFDQEGDPHERYVQYVAGEIRGTVYDDEFTGEPREVPLGSLTVAVVDLWEADDRITDVLDSHSSEWINS